MHSVSEVVVKIAPSASRRSRSSTALTRLPLCPTRHRAARVLDGDGLRVLLGRVAGRRVADVTDGGEARQVRQAIGREDVVDVPHLAHVAQMVAVGRDDAGGLLAAVLQGVEAEVGEVRGLRVSVDADDAAHGSCGRGS